MHTTVLAHWGAGVVSSSMAHFDHAGLRFEVREGGDSGGEPVVFLHGFPQDPASFDEVLPPLQAAGLRTLVPTQRGYAPGNRPARRRDYRGTELVGDVLALLDAFGLEQVHVVGHDWGGFQAWGMAGWHPDRVRSIVAVSTPHPRAMMRSLVRSNQGLRSWYMAYFQLPRLPESLIRRGLRDSLIKSRLPAHYVDTYVAAMSQPGTLTGALNWYRGLPFSARPQVGEISVPTTYVWGRHDFALGPTAAQLTARYVRAPYAFVELDAGHWIPETEPAALADAILRRVGGPNAQPG